MIDLDHGTAESTPPAEPSPLPPQAPLELAKPVERPWNVPRLRSLDTFLRSARRCSTIGTRRAPPGRVLLTVTWSGGVVSEVDVTTDPGLESVGQCMAAAAASHLPASEDGVVTIPMQIAP